MHDQVSKDRRVAVLGFALLAGCATQTHDSVAFTGRVSDRLEAGGTNGSIRGADGIYRPGMGGALGGAVAYLLAASKSTALYHFYELQLNDGTSKSVPSREDHVEGECLTVLAPPDKTSLNTNWEPEDVTFQPSNACKPMDTTPKFAFAGVVLERFETAGSKTVAASGSLPTLAYEMRLNDGSIQGVPSREEHAPGECLDVWTMPTRLF